MFKSFALGMTGIAAGLAATAAGATRSMPQYTSITVFGDSVIDAGNYFKSTNGAAPAAADGYSGGRFSNGYTYVDLLSIDLFGTPTRASDFAGGGTNFAFGGASATNSTGVPDLPEQLGKWNTYLAGGGSVDANGLYVIGFGANDVFANASNQAALQTAAAALANTVKTLNDAGVRNILITSFPSLHTNNATENGAATLANGYLTSDLAGLSLDPSTTLFKFSYADFFNKVAANPSSLGLPALNFSTDCRTANAVSSNCAGYFSFDGTHFTAQIHAAAYREMQSQFELIATASVLVPEPATWTMMIGGFALVGAATRRRARRADVALD